MSPKIHSLVFSSENWTDKNAQKWAESKGFDGNGLQKTAETIRIFQPGTFDGDFHPLSEGFPLGVAAIACQGQDKADAPRKVERRHCQELRVSDEDGRLTGYAAVFNEWSEQMFGFREKIAPGAFKKSLDSGQDVKALVEHEPRLIIGRRKSETLRLQEDKKGLRVEIDLPDTTVGRDVRKSVERGDLDSMSFGFTTVADKWEKQDEDIAERTLLEVNLFDVSVVAFPAYEQTSVALRSLDRQRSLDRAVNVIEQSLRAANRAARARLLRLADSGF